MPTQCEAIVEAFKDLLGVRTRQEIEDWVNKKYKNKWKDFGTAMADMVPLSLKGNSSSKVPNSQRVLERVSRGKYRLLSHVDNEAASSENLLSCEAINMCIKIEQYEINDAKQLLGEEYNNISQIIRSAKKVTHADIVQSFKKAGWSTEVPLLGRYRCDAFKNKIGVEVESVDKSSVVDVLHRDFFRFMMLHRMHKLKVAILITRISGGEVSLKKVKDDLEIYGEHYETPLMVFGISEDSNI
ncbi:MAG TPA: hypothetical protein ENN22_08485 [bacterium]|nr:hypothetical protein [bacterium]